MKKLFLLIMQLALTYGFAQQVTLSVGGNTTGSSGSILYSIR